MGKILWQEKLASSQDIVELKLLFSVTSGAVAALTTTSYPAIIGSASTDFTIATTNALLVYDSTGAALSTTATTELATTTMFGSTAMGTDAFGYIIYCGGQVKTAHMATARLDGTASSVPLSESIIAVTTEPGNSLANAVYKTPAGNLAGRFVITGLDALSDGQLTVSLFVSIK
jgi:hypothetical protein